MSTSCNEWSTCIKFASTVVTYHNHFCLSYSAATFVFMFSFLFWHRINYVWSFQRIMQSLNTRDSKVYYESFFILTCFANGHVFMYLAMTTDYTCYCVLNIERKENNTTLSNEGEMHGLHCNNVYLDRILNGNDIHLKI